MEAAMNRIYQGRVRKGEILDTGIFGSKPFEK
jgi:hypothetical protein